MTEVNLVQAPLVIHNLHGPDPSATNRHKTILAFLKAADGGLGGFNELRTADRTFIRNEAAARKMRIFIAGEDGMVWDPTKFSNGKARIKKIMTGGHVGADGVATAKKGDDDRRVGPNRYGIYLPLRVIALGLDIEFDVTHTMARSFTKNKWRLPLFKRSIVSLGAGVQEEEGIMVGDMNSPAYINLPGVADVPVPTPPSMGRARYDQILKWGKHILVSSVRSVNTPSDHHMIVATVTFYRSAKSPQPPTTKPTSPHATKPTLPKPGNSGVSWRKYGSPVAHPWAKRSASWKKRHRTTWAKIVKWQAAYRRRL